jgi:hypothetical protein
MSFQSLSPVSFESVSAVTASPTVELGSMRVEGLNEYIYCYNAGNSQISVGRVAVVSALSGLSVTVSSVSGDFAVGVVKHATMATGTYGWLLKRGFVDGMTNGMASTAVVAGDILQVAIDGSVGKGITGPNVGKAMTATGSAGVCNAFIALY